MNTSILCSHRGYNTVAPENTLPAFAFAVALGAPEIEFDLWPSRDGQLVVCHDPTVDRTTDGRGVISELTATELQELNASCGMEWFEGVQLPLFEDVLKCFAGKVIMNIHIKSPFEARDYPEAMRLRGRTLAQQYRNTWNPEPFADPEPHVISEWEDRAWKPYDCEIFAEILRLLERYDCRDSVYVTGERDVLETASSMAPDLGRCCLEGHMNFTIVRHAQWYGCNRLQFCKGLTTRTMIAQAKQLGMVCNLFWSDDAVEAMEWIDMGIDVILVNDLFALQSRLNRLIDVGGVCCI